MAITITCDICGATINDENHRDSVITVKLDGWGPGRVYDYMGLGLCEQETSPEHSHHESMGHLCGKCQQFYIEAKGEAFTEIVAILKSIKGRIGNLAAKAIIEGKKCGK